MNHQILDSMLLVGFVILLIQLARKRLLAGGSLLIDFPWGKLFAEFEAKETLTRAGSQTRFLWCLWPSQKRPITFLG